MTLGLRLAPLVVPKLEANDVELKGLLVTARRGDALQHYLILPDDRVAGVALFAVTWRTPESRHAVIRQTAVLELLRMMTRIAPASIVRVRKVGQPEITEIRSWGAHERVAIRRP